MVSKSGSLSTVLGSWRLAVVGAVFASALGCADETEPTSMEEDDSSRSDDDGGSWTPDRDVVEDIEFVSLPPGTFEMGCTRDEGSCGGDELPAHSVTLSRGLWMAMTELTHRQYESLMGIHQVGTCGTDCPAVYLTWWDMLEFANALSSAAGLASCYDLSGCEHSADTGELLCWGAGAEVTTDSGSVYDCVGYRLPTEAEWEYAARAGSDLMYSGSDVPANVAWTGENAEGTLHEVAGLEPNGWGIYDLSGNAVEHVWDLYADDYYSEGPPVDPEGPAWEGPHPDGPATDYLRVGRGGAVTVPASAARVSWREGGWPSSRTDILGFRLVRTIP